MNILYILGNGFDKAQGLATTYPEFYADWLKRKPESELEQKVLNSIQGDYETWADLEKGLGEYSAKWADEREFRKILNLFNARLKEYLIAQNNRLEGMDLSRAKLLNHLCQPELFLEPSVRAVYERLVYSSHTSVHIDVVTFNYTNTLELALRGIYRGDILQQFYNNNYYFDGILHLHGTLDEMILVGVNDESQIANVTFRDNQYLRKSFIKPEINEGCMNTRNSDFSIKIESADIIVFFGASIGETDNLWWHLIGLRMAEKNPPLLLYFPYDPSKDTVATPNYKRIWCDEYISFLQDRMQIKQSRDVLEQSIRIGINKDFLKLSDQS